MHDDVMLVQSTVVQSISKILAILGILKEAEGHAWNTISFPCGEEVRTIRISTRLLKNDFIVKDGILGA